MYLWSLSNLETSKQNEECNTHISHLNHGNPFSFGFYVTQWGVGKNGKMDTTSSGPEFKSPAQKCQEEVRSPPSLSKHCNHCNRNLPTVSAKTGRKPRSARGKYSLLHATSKLGWEEARPREFHFLPWTKGLFCGSESPFCWTSILLYFQNGAADCNGEARNIKQPEILG